jgi:hypothetical protein
MTICEEVSNESELSQSMPRDAAVAIALFLVIVLLKVMVFFTWAPLLLSLLSRFVFSGYLRFCLTIFLRSVHPGSRWIGAEPVEPKLSLSIRWGNLATYPSDFNIRLQKIRPEKIPCRVH